MTSSSAKAAAFIVTVIVFMSAPPLINWHKHTSTSPFKFDRQTLYNTDFVIKPLQRAVFNYGIRLSPKKVVIGKNQWLFLGDKFANNVTRRIEGVSAQDREWIKTSVQHLKTWQERFEANGVKEFRLLFGPDKATIYSRYLPDWARAAKPTRADVLFKELNDSGLNLATDPRATLILAKDKHSDPLYMRTDTHWNDLGAWIAFDHFVRTSRSAKIDHINWPDRSMFEFRSAPRAGGDLSRLLKIDLTDISLKAVFKQTTETRTEKLQLPAKTVASMAEDQRVKFNANAHRHYTANALNEKRILLIRDSFADALLPFYQRTFSDVIDVHHTFYTQDVLMHLLHSFQPEIVHLVIVERDAIDQYLGFKQVGQ